MDSLSAATEVMISYTCAFPVCSLLDWLVTYIIGLRDLGAKVWRQFGMESIIGKINYCHDSQASDP